MQFVPNLSEIKGDTLKLQQRERFALGGQQKKKGEIGGNVVEKSVNLKWGNN